MRLKSSALILCIAVSAVTALSQSLAVPQLIRDVRVFDGGKITKIEDLKKLLQEMLGP